MFDSPVLILGYGREGQSVDAFLKTRYPNLEVVICDQKQPTTERTFIQQEELKNQNRFFPTIIKSPGIPLHADFVQDFLKQGSKLSSLTNIFFQHCQGRTIGVTGTKGKSTTCALVSTLLKQKFSDVRLVGNIGNPALDYLEDQNKESIFVIELSSYQLETCNFSPEISVLLQIHPEHLDYHKNMENYRAAKYKIYQNSGLLISHTSNNTSSSIRLINYGLCSGNYHWESASLIENEKVISEFSNPNLKGAGNLQNVLAAIAVARELKLSWNEIQKGINDYKPLEHRLEKVGTYKDITFYNDSLATIPEATIVALDTLGSDVETLIAGGHDRGVDYKLLGERIAESNIKTLILFPITGEKILEAIRHHRSTKLTTFSVNNMKEAVNIAYQNTDPGKICLMSPASSSLNLFKDYRDRAEQYINAIKEAQID